MRGSMAGMPSFAIKDQLIMTAFVALGALLACGAFALGSKDTPPEISATMWFSGWGLIGAGIGILFKRFWLGLLIGIALAFIIVCVLVTTIGC
jgi:hypothetical protein